MKLGSGELLLEKWNIFVTDVSKDNSTFGALLRSAKPLLAEGECITVGVYYKFHQEQLSDTKFLVLVQDYVEKIAGGYIKFTFELTDSPRATDKIDENDTTKDLAQLATESLM